MLRCDAPLCTSTAAFLAPRYRNGTPEDDLEWIQLCPDCVRERTTDIDELPPLEHRLPIISLPAEIFAIAQRIKEDEIDT